MAQSDQQVEKVNSNMFKVVGVREKETDKLAEKSISFWKEVILRFSQNKVAIIGLFLLLLIAIMAIVVPFVSPYNYREQLGLYNAAPSAVHWFGTDDLGRDMFVRVWEGARISLFIGLTAAVIDLIIGVLWGSIAGFQADDWTTS